jgi:hypothetical protein
MQNQHERYVGSTRLAMPKRRNLKWESRHAPKRCKRRISGGRKTTCMRGSRADDPESSGKGKEDRMAANHTGTVPTLVVPTLETTGSEVDTRFRSLRDTVVSKLLTCK